MARDRLTDTLGPAVGRRAMLQGLGLGLAGLALAPPAARAATSSSPDLLFSFQGEAGHTPSGIPALAPGAVVWVETFKTSSGTGSQVTSYPLSDEDDPWWYDIDSTEGFQTPAVVDDAVIVASGDGTVVSLAVADGTVNWTTYYPVANTRACPFAQYGTDVLFVTTSGTLVRLDSASNQVYAVDLGLGDAGTGFSAPVVVGDTAVVLGAGQLTARDAASGDFMWTIPVPDHADSHPVLAGSVGAVHYAVKGTSSSKGAVVAIDIDSGAQLWSAKPADAHVAISAPAYGSGAVFYGDASGTIGALNATTGEPLWSQSVGGDLSESDIVVDDGVVYATSQKSSTTRVHALPVGGGEEVKYKTGFPGVALIGVQNGLCFYSKVHKSQRIKVEGVDLGDTLSEFYSQSQLLASGYEGDTESATPNTPHFQTDIGLFTALQSPRANAPVRVKVSEAATVIIDGTTHHLGTSDHVWTTSDAAGELSIVVEPKNDQLDCPKLKLWGPFMGAGESMVVFPDQDMVSSLSTISGTKMAGLADFSGSYLLPDSYRDGTKDPESVASRIRAVLGTVTTTFAGSSLIDLDPPYTAFPGESTNLAFQAKPGSTARAYVPPADDEDWVATFDDDGLVDLALGTTTAPGGSGRTIKGAKKSGLGSSKKKGWDDFFEDVVKGTKKLTKITWKAGKKAVKTLEAGIDDFYEFEVDELEKGMGIIAGVMKTFGKDMRHIIEMLTHFLDWARIKTLHKDIKSAVKDTLTTQAASTAANTLVSDIKSLASTITSDLDSLVEELEGQGPRTHTKGVGMHKVYGSSYNQAKWVQGQVKTNLTKGTISSSTVLGSAPDLNSILDEIFDAVASQLGSEVSTQAKELFSATSQKVGSAKQLAEATFADLLDLLALAIDAIIDAVAITAEETVLHIPDIVDAVLALFDAHIDIPVISDLYKLISGDHMSFLDMACLIIAIPTSILAPGEDEVETGVGASHDLNVASVIAQGMFLVIKVFADSYAVATKGNADPETAKFVATVWGIFDAIVIGLSFPLFSGEDDVDWETWGMFVAQLVPLTLVLGRAYEQKPEDGSDKKFSDKVVLFGSLIIGVVGMAMAGIQAYIRSTQNQGKLSTKQVEQLANRLLTFLPLALKPMLLGPTAVGVVFVVIEAACGVIAVILTVVETGLLSAAPAVASSPAPSPGRGRLQRSVSPA